MYTELQYATKVNKILRCAKVIVIVVHKYMPPSGHTKGEDIMPREKEAYRDNLERLCEAFPTKELLSRGDVMRFTGLGYKCVGKRYPFKQNYISKASLARELS